MCSLTVGSPCKGQLSSAEKAVGGLLHLGRRENPRVNLDPCARLTPACISRSTAGSDTKGSEPAATDVSDILRSIGRFEEAAEESIRLPPGACQMGAKVGELSAVGLHGMGPECLQAQIKQKRGPTAHG